MRKGCDQCNNGGTRLVIMQGFSSRIRAMAIKGQPLNFPLTYELMIPCDCNKGLTFLQHWPSMEGISAESHARAIKLCSFNVEEKALYYKQRAELPELQPDDPQAIEFLGGRKVKEAPKLIQPEL